MTNYNLLYFDRSWLLIAVWQLCLNRVSRFIQGVLSGITDQLRHFSKTGEFIVPAKSLQMLSSVSSGYKASGNGLTWTHTVDSGTDCLIIGISAVYTCTGLTSITCGAQSMDVSNKIIYDGSRLICIAFLKNPTPGNQTITCNFTGTMTQPSLGYATNWIGTQAVPLRAISSTTVLPGTSISVSPTSAIGDVMIDVLGSYVANNTPVAGQTVLDTGFSTYLGMSIKPGVAGSTSMGWTFSSNYAALIGVAIKGS